MIDPSRRTVLANGAAAAAASAVPQVFAQAQEAVPGLPAGAKVGFYERGNVRIRFAEIGSGFPLLATPGGGLNSRIAVWARAVINIPEEFKNDFRVITMDQRNATGGESAGPVAVDDPWGAFAADQLGVMDHLGIDKFFFFGNCIGGPFAMKLMARAPARVAAAILSQPVGHRPSEPDYMYNSGKDVWAKDFLPRRPDVTMATVEQQTSATVSTNGDGGIPVENPATGQVIGSVPNRSANEVAEIVAKARAVLDLLVHQGIADPERVAACGTSRGGFLAYHFAASESRVKAVAGISPVTRLNALRELATTSRREPSSSRRSRACGPTCVPPCPTGAPCCGGSVR